MKVFYSRISSSDGSQSDERQLQNLKGFDYVLSDKCSGTIPLWDRPKGSQIKKLIDKGDLTELHIHNIDRLGRCVVSTLSVWKELTDLGVRVVCRNPNFQNIDEEGKTDMFSELMISILSTMSDFERKMIRETKWKGLELEKKRDCIKERRLEQLIQLRSSLTNQVKGYSKRFREWIWNQRYIKMRDCSYSTIYKVKKLNDEN